MADAVDNGCKHVITCGPVQSNHCRAVAVAARQIGLTPHLVLRADVNVRFFQVLASLVFLVYLFCGCFFFF
jgi:1-aminocyclopropane-1-carboxylate deaminase/D-cysteine desulfhydrase-like pyridoxal-dependent ACC family enzyme